MSKHLQSGQHPDADQICAFVDHALPVHEREEMLAHLAECKDCRETVLLSLPTIDRAPAVVKKGTSWFWDLRFLLPVGAAALAVVLLYVHQAKNPQRQDVGRGPEIALERPAPPVKDQKSSPGGAAGGAGSTSFAGRALPAPRRTAPARTAAAAKEQSETENRVAVEQSAISNTVHLPDGRIPISTVTRGTQMLAIDERNQLFLSNDRGASWLAVQVPWRSRAVKAELTSYPIPNVARDKAASGIGAGFGAGLGSGEGALKAMNSADADQFEKQKKVRQELKGSYQAPPVNGASDAPAAAPASAHTAPTQGPTSSSRGSFSGVITDRAGAVISGASVVLTNQNDHASSTAVTGHDGRFQHNQNLRPPDRLFSRKYEEPRS